MEMRVVWRSLRRRWYLVLALAVLTLGATLLVAQRTGETYEATATVLVFPPAQAQDPTGAMTQANPYLVLGGVSQARDVVVRALTSKKIADTFGETYPTGTTFEITPDFTNSAPIIVFTVEAPAPDVAIEALKTLTDRVPVELEKMQSELDLPAGEQVTSVVLTRDEVPATTKKAMIRSALMTMAGLGGLGLLLIALVDGWLTGRRSPSPEDTVADDDAGASAPVSLHPVHVDAPAPDGRDPDRAAQVEVTARLLKRRGRRDQRGEAS
ncbi:hypothetical protein IEZ26_00830 [Nocardioides cavernae]|uniref:Polysaccharide chain length determinant N-terminal domain-containing protein n=1 Tax=Nocardioides cavernae TaxID=1921566 RepID=A0ABR8N9L3_9ACTN|nr:Wzz/FepE/Etk N-terminal domain-containing protein [Nocardioides cavernae]MBD3923149.1 hypothetical protein [Nocardioides cavernae]MBM7511930.1 hypothetical protein [Nocardioides cavernae]